jgi:ssDNA thymidine ADP-ribosyltransferase, DarT
MDARVTEFQCIMPIQNIPSVLAHGILSHERAAELSHVTVAMEVIQDKRDKKHVPGGLKLHQYANLYFHARNPMMSKRRDESSKLCILQVSLQVLKIPGAVITDQNAASSYVRFHAPNQISLLNFDDIFARNWKHSEDQIREWKHSSAKCAEVLIPHRIPPELIEGAFVVNAVAKQSLTDAGFPLSIGIDADLFFH